MSNIVKTIKRIPPFVYGMAAALVVLLPIGLLHFLGDAAWVQTIFGGGKTLVFWAVGLFAIYGVERVAGSSKSSRIMDRETVRSVVVTGHELILVSIGVLAFLVPLFLVQIHPDNEWVQKYLSGWKVFAFWVVTIGALYSIEMILRRLGLGGKTTIDE